MARVPRESGAYDEYQDYGSRDYGEAGNKLLSSQAAQEKAGLTCYSTPLCCDSSDFAQGQEVKARGTVATASSASLNSQLLATP